MCGLQEKAEGKDLKLFVVEQLFLYLENINSSAGVATKSAFRIRSLRGSRQTP